MNIKCYANLVSSFVAVWLTVTGFADPSKAAGDDTQVDAFSLIRSGELHYDRVPVQHWSHRLQLVKALGFNAVSTYVFWNSHERQRGRFDFEGQRDVASFCRIARDNGLQIILRPGPYVCAERDFGGLPSWLLKDRSAKVRSRNAEFLAATREYFLELGRQLAPLQITRAGPIIMVQVENEYDGYGKDPQYVNALVGFLKEAGFDVPFFTSEMTWSLNKATHTNLLATIGLSRDAEKHFQTLRAFQPGAPLMAGEFYTGWYDSWGIDSSKPIRPEPPKHFLETLDWMLANKVSFNLYMLHGGTSFGFTSGANAEPFRPQPTSYDYDAPITEAGWPTPKFFAIRERLAKLSSTPLPEVPPNNPVIQVPPFGLTESGTVFNNLPKAKSELWPKPMEMFDQPHGLMLYRTKLPAGDGEKLVINELHDYGLIFIDSKQIATLDRRLKQKSVTLPKREKEATLDILIEAMGRVHYGPFLHDRKGITESVQLIQGNSIREMTGWEIFNLPLFEKDLQGVKYSNRTESGPAFYRGTFSLSAVGDTFLDLREWSKGVVWVNGHNLGRFWSIGPQQTLYCPGPWLKKGVNEIVVLDLHGSETRSIQGLAQPILTDLRPQQLAQEHREGWQNLNLTNQPPVHTGVFPPENGWQMVRFVPAKGRFFALEALSSQTNDTFTTCAELQLFDEKGIEIPLKEMKVVYADSEEVYSEDGSAKNVIDGDTATFWHTRWRGPQPKHPHHVVIDLGRERTVSGFRYLPRQDMKNGRIRDYRVFISREIFQGLAKNN